MTENIYNQPTNSAANAKREMEAQGTDPVEYHPLVADKDVEMSPEVAAFFEKFPHNHQRVQLSRYAPHHGILSDWEITALCTPGIMPWLKAPMLDPFVGTQIKTGRYRDFLVDPKKSNIGLPQEILEKIVKIISYGVSSFGYDCRLAPEYKVFTNAANDGGVIDPLNFREDAYIPKSGPWCVIPPNSYILGRTIEYFTMPEDVVSVCLGKSTYARSGIAVNVTPIEPGWEGHVTLEISNQTPLPIRVYANMGICQFLFLRGFRPQTTYADKDGKYMGQRGITPPKV